MIFEESKILDSKQIDFVTPNCKFIVDFEHESKLPLHTQVSMSTCEAELVIIGSHIQIVQHAWTFIAWIFIIIVMQSLQ